MRVLIVGGGTGGHVIPALALASELRDHHGALVRFVGTTRGFETRLVPQAGYALDLIKVGQLKGVGLVTRLRTLLDLPLGIRACVGIVNEFRPDAVVGVGGYASGPGMIAALLQRVPTLAFEPNAVPGLANRLVGKRVSAAAVGFAPACKYFRNPQVTGIPVRQEFFVIEPKRPGGTLNLLVFGGSQGARVFNNIMPQIATSLLESVPGLTILHQTGARHAETTQAAYIASGADPARWQVQAFLEDMAARFAAADLVLARSGASTVAELAAGGRPAILVPFPQAADDHQRKNAEVMCQVGAARMFIEAELTKDILGDTLGGLLKNRPALAEMGQCARMLAHPDATEKIVRMVVQIAGR